MPTSALRTISTIARQPRAANPCRGTQRRGPSVRMRAILTLALCICCLGASFGCGPKKISSDDFSIGPVRLNMPYSDVVSLLGSPAMEEPTNEGGLHQFVIDEATRLTVATDASGVSSMWLEPVIDGWLMYSGMDAASGGRAKLGIDKLGTPRSITIGTDVGQVAKRYGKPYSTTKDEEFFQYRLADSKTFMNFECRDGRIVAIIISRVTWSND